MIPEIFEFNRSVVKARTNEPLDRDWLLDRLEEEVQEFIDSKHLVDEVDALIDLVYYAIGGLYRLGLTIDQAEECFSVVHKANMLKKKGIRRIGVANKRGEDAVKPKGWQDPKEKLQGILKNISY